MGNSCSLVGLAVATLFIVCDGNDSELGPVAVDVKRCSPSSLPTAAEALALECVEFPPHAFFSATAGNTSAEESQQACRLCLYDIRLKILDTDRFQDHGQCTSLPAVLYEVIRTDAKGGVRLNLSCAKAACPISALLACTGSQNVRRAVYWEPLAALLSWSGSFPSRADAPTRPAPGAPPYTRFRCMGPPLSFYQRVSSLPPWPAPHRCGNRVFYPISFGIPQEDIVDCLPEKSVDFASLVPGRLRTYVFPITSTGELEYKRMYRDARYALNPRKHGWETMRIYEILASGAVPYVENITKIPPGALAFLDKELLRAAMNLPGVDASRLRCDTSSFNEALYSEHAAALLRHTQRRLSTDAIARYMLDIVGKSDAKRILYLAPCGHGDYQCYLSLHGFRRLLGDGLVDFPRLDYMYQSRLGAMREIDRMTACPKSLCTVVAGSYQGAIIRGLGAPMPAYGGGFSYGFRLEDIPVNRSTLAIAEQIRRRSFDAVVLGTVEMDPFFSRSKSARRMANLWQLTLQHYPPKDILILDGRDPPEDKPFYDDVEQFADKGHFFLREIPDEVCSNMSP